MYVIHRLCTHRVEVAVRVCWRYMGNWSSFHTGSTNTFNWQLLLAGIFRIRTSYIFSIVFLYIPFSFAASYFLLNELSVSCVLTTPFMALQSTIHCGLLYSFTPLWVGKQDNFILFRNVRVQSNIILAVKRGNRNGVFNVSGIISGRNV